MVVIPPGIQLRSSLSIDNNATMAQTPRTLPTPPFFFAVGTVRVLRNQDYLQAFVRELAADPQMGKSIKQLQIIGQGNGNGADVCLWIDTIPRLLHGKLPNLKSIHFNCVAWDRSHLNPPLNAQLVPGLSEAFPTVVTLEFKDCSFAHFRDLEAVLLSFPNLSHLSVDTLMGLPANDKETLDYLTIPVLPRADVRLQTLRLVRYSRMELLFAWLRLTATMTSDNLNLILFAVSNEHEVFVVTQLLEILGPVLRDLTIGNTFNCDNLNPLREPFIDISHNTRLVSLYFSFPSMEPHTVSWALSILAQLTSPRIREIAIVVFLSDETQLQDAIWSEFVAKVGALNLQKMTVMHGGTLEWKRARKAIKATFSRLPNPRILQMVTR
ncbi:hypothetical protein B0H21DRAFT_201713 [Amylocystis lapponica]|nr:hypothetical protein B0H21DRAFT_201713 [Amylocystis lapponica]